MRYMMLLTHDDEAAVYDAPPDPAMFEEMGRYNTALVDAGVLLVAEGLASTKDGAMLRFDGEEPTVTDGPFTEATEVVGGFWILDVASREEALTWARRAPLGPGTTLTVRRVAEMSDFVDIAPEAVLEAEETLRARVAERGAERSRTVGAEQRGE